MAFKHSIYVFDYLSYKENLQRYRSDIERGNLDSLFQVIQEIRKQVGGADQWILNGQGTSIDTVWFEQNDKYRNGMIGYWLLLILSTYLKPAISLGYHWSRLYLLLRTLGWKEEDVHKAIIGNPVEQLMIPEYKVSIVESIKWSDPYWMWIRPERCIKSGWLSLEQVSMYKERLDIIYNQIIYKDNVLNDELVKHKFTLEEVDELLTSILSSYKLAISFNLGLYSIIFEED